MRDARDLQQHCWHAQLAVLAACEYLEIRVLEKKGRPFLVMLSIMWLF